MSCFPCRYFLCLFCSSNCYSSGKKSVIPSNPLFYSQPYVTSNKGCDWPIWPFARVSSTKFQYVLILILGARKWFVWKVGVEQGLEWLKLDGFSAKESGDSKLEIEVLCYIYMFFNHCIMNKGFVLFTPVNKRCWVTEIVNSTGEFDLQQTQPEQRVVLASTSTTLYRLSCGSSNTTWAQKVWTNRPTGDRPTYKGPATQLALIGAYRWSATPSGCYIGLVSSRSHIVKKDFLLLKRIVLSSCTD